MFGWIVLYGKPHSVIESISLFLCVRDGCGDKFWTVCDLARIQMWFGVRTRGMTPVRFTLYNDYINATSLHMKASVDTKVRPPRHYNISVSAPLLLMHGTSLNTLLLDYWGKRCMIKLCCKKIFIKYLQYCHKHKSNGGKKKNLHCTVLTSPRSQNPCSPNYITPSSLWSLCPKCCPLLNMFPSFFNVCLSICVRVALLPSEEMVMGS